MRSPSFVVVPGLLFFVAGAVAGGELVLLALGVHRELWPVLAGGAFCAASLIAAFHVASLSRTPVLQAQGTRAGTGVSAVPLTVCSFCRKVLDEDGTWRPFETFLLRRDRLRCSHGACPQCEEKVRRNAF